MRPKRVVALVAVFLVVLGAAVAAGQRWIPSSVPLAPKPTKVIVFGMAPLGFADLGKGSSPHLDQLLRDGAAAAMSTRTSARRSTPDEGYLSLGAGSRLKGDSRAGEAYEVTSRPLAGGVVAVGASASVSRNKGSTYPTKPGALGQALEDAGRTVAVVSNSDGYVPHTGEWRLDRPAALAAMDANLTVPAGVVSAEHLLQKDELAPSGVRADPDAVVAATTRLSRSNDIVFVDPGDLARASSYASVAAEEPGRLARAQALAREDAMLGRILDQADPGTLVMVVSVAAPGPGLHLAPVAFTGAGVRPGYIISPSTKRTGVIAITDLAPTILSALGVKEPAEMPGNAVEYHPGSVDLQRLRDLDRDTAFREWSYYGWSLGFIDLHALVYGVGAFLLWRGAERRKARAAVRLGALGLAAFPLATFVFRMIPSGAALGHSAILVVLGIDVAITLVAARFRRTPLAALQVVMAATLAVILADASTGTRLHLNGWLGYSLHGGGRFYGIPNTTYGLIAAGGLLLAAAHVQYAERRGEAVLAGGLLLALVVAVDGAPSLGGDVGGIISLVPVFAVVLLLLAGRRIRPRTLLAIGIVTAVVLGAATGLDLLRPPEARTHLGRFAATVAHDGPSAIYDTFLRKQRANFSILRVSVWSRMLPITAAFLYAVAGKRRQRAAFLPSGSAVQLGVVGTLGCAAVGFLSNDSGPIVIGLFFAFLLPFVLLLALDQPSPSAPAGLVDAEGTAGQEPDPAPPATSLAPR